MIKSSNAQVFIPRSGGFVIRCLRVADFRNFIVGDYKSPTTGKRGTAKLAKIWLEPTISVADKGSLTDTQIKSVVAIISEYRTELLSQWEAFRNGDKVKMIKIKKK